MADKANRIDWIDCSKGIAILLTIIGHTVSGGLYGSTLRGMIFSFHMPLFFILSCVTYRYARNDEELKDKAVKSGKHLLLPAIVTYLIIIVLQIVNDHSILLSIEYWKGRLYTFLFASGVGLSFNEFDVSALGIPWFFFALFIGRTVFDYLHLKTKNDSLLFILSCVFGMEGIFFGKLQWLPFSIDIALAILPFMYFGYYLKKHLDIVGNHSARSVIFWGSLWFVTFYIIFPDYNNWTYLELACRRYDFFPICYVTAIAGTMLVNELSYIYCKLYRLSAPIIYIGKNSLYLLCIHALDGLFLNLWTVCDHQFLTGLKRVVIDLLIFIFIMVLKYELKQIQQKNKD